MQDPQIVWMNLSATAVLSGQSVRSHGRVFEAGMVARYKLASKDLFGDTRLALEMLKRGKLKFLPGRIKGRREVRAMFDRENLPRREAAIRNRIKSAGFWMR